jgi:hypothetical protein
MDPSGGEIESRSWLARQILTRQLQTLISLDTEGEVEEERVEKLHDQLRNKCDGSSPADFSDFVDAGGIQFILVRHFYTNQREGAARGSASAECLNCSLHPGPRPTMCIQSPETQEGSFGGGEPCFCQVLF